MEIQYSENVQQIIKDVRDNTNNGIYDGSIVLHDKNMTVLPDFSDISITGDFLCRHNTNLVSLKGSPKKVGGRFACRNNKNLKSLEGAPKSVGGRFSCNDNNLTSLKYLPYDIKGEIKADDRFTKEDIKRAQSQSRLSVAGVSETVNSFKDFFHNI